jgi:hypothetical protein
MRSRAVFVKKAAGEWKMVNGKWWLNVARLECNHSAPVALSHHLPFTINYLLA